MSLTAAYTSPTNDVFAVALSLSPVSSDKATYLAALSDAIATAKGIINAELTARMAQDSERTAVSAGPSATAVDDAKEEENYGEEVQEED